MEVFYIITGLFTGILGVILLGKFLWDSVSYPMFFTMVGFVFWTAYAVAKVF